MIGAGADTGRSAEGRLTSRSGALGAARAVLAYLDERFPPVLGTALVITFGTGVALCARAVEDDLRWELLVGALTFVLAFLQLRLVDDLDDLDLDVAEGRVPAAARDRLRRRYLTAGVAIFAVICALNIAWPVPLAAVAAASALMVFAPFVLKRHISDHPVALAPGYEGGPALLMLYVPLLWGATAGEPLPAAATLGVAGLLFATYEIWKFSRKLGHDAFQPYDLTWRGQRRALFALLALAAGCVLAIEASAALSTPLVVYGCLAPAAFAVWMVLEPPRAVPPGRSAPGARWAGLAFPAAMQAGLLVEALAAGVAW